MNPCRIVSSAFALPGHEITQKFSPLLRDGELILDSSTVEIPPSDLLSSRLKRRMSRLIQMTIATTHAARAGFPLADDIPLVFGSANGEINTIGSVIKDIFQEQALVSPSQFHNSVHNSAPGYWSILTKLHHASTTISADNLTFGYSLMQAITFLSDDCHSAQLTVGDEKIEIPQWADPAHASIDFCASLIISTQPSFSQGTILDVQHITSRTELLRLIDAMNPCIVRSDIADIPGALPVRFSIIHRHPCSALLHLLSFLESAIQLQKILLIEGTDADDCIAIIVEKL